MDQPRRRRGERGSTLVETAIVLPLGLALLFGIVTGGSAYARKISLVDATRDGARFGASLKVPDSGIEAWKDAVRARVADLSGGDVDAADVCADLIDPTSSNTSCGVANPEGASTDLTGSAPTRVVKVSVATSARLDFIFFTSNPTLSAKVAARYERDVL